MQEEFEVCHLPYIENLKPFLDWMKIQLQENSMYKMASSSQFELSTIREILHTWMLDPNQPVIRHKRNGEEVHTFRCIENNLFDATFDNIVADNDYPFIVKDTSHYRSYEPELLSYIKYSLVESLVCDFFQSVRKQVFHYHNDGVERIVKGLRDTTLYSEDELEKLSLEYYQSHGPAQTKAGEFLRGVGKVMYHIYNDGDNPTNYAARDSQFWAMVNCCNTIVSSSANYQLYLSIITDEEKKRWHGGDYQIYFSSEVDQYTIINLVNFAIAYTKTAEGREENIIDCITPIHKNIDWYDEWIPSLEKHYN